MQFLGDTGLFAPAAPCMEAVLLLGGIGRLTFPFACCPGAAEPLAAFGKVLGISGGENCSHSSTEGARAGWGAVSQEQEVFMDQAQVLLCALCLS